MTNNRLKIVKEDETTVINDNSHQIYNQLN